MDDGEITPESLDSSEDDSRAKQVHNITLTPTWIKLINLQS